jgi:predicted lipoprotein with Yx(FWY)xxD motif
MQAFPRAIGSLAVLAGFMLAACGGTTAGTGAATSPSSGALIHTASMKVGDKNETVLKNTRGLTLYYFTPDSATTIACTGTCATNWPPLIATDDNPSSNPSLPGRLTVLSGPNGKQVVYNGHPLYTYAKDQDSGDAYGEGIGGKWFVATPQLAAASAPASASASASQTPYGY